MVSSIKECSNFDFKTFGYGNTFLNLFDSFLLGLIIYFCSDPDLRLETTYSGPMREENDIECSKGSFSFMIRKRSVSQFQDPHSQFLRLVFNAMISILIFLEPHISWTRYWRKRPRFIEVFVFIFFNRKGRVVFLNYPSHYFYGSFGGTKESQMTWCLEKWWRSFTKLAKWKSTKEDQVSKGKFNNVFQKLIFL